MKRIADAIGSFYLFALVAITFVALGSVVKGMDPLPPPVTSYGFKSNSLPPPVKIIGETGPIKLGPKPITAPLLPPKRVTATDGTVVELRNGSWYVVSKLNVTREVVTQRPFVSEAGTSVLGPTTIYAPIAVQPSFRFPAREAGHIPTFALGVGRGANTKYGCLTSG